jgi:hypothetical protein
MEDKTGLHILSYFLLLRLFCEHLYVLKFISCTSHQDLAQSGPMEAVLEP